VPTPALDEWISLLQSFASGSIPGSEFDSNYFALFRRANEAQDAGQPWVTPEAAAAAAETVLSDFFVEVDCLSNDPTQFPDDFVTEEELRPAAGRVADQLEQLSRHS
jgi:hypothetical protein